MADKRIIRRLKKRITIRFGSDEPSRLAFTEDVSVDGLFIKTTNISRPGSLIRVVMELDGGVVVELDGRVMWAKKVPPQMIHLVRKSGMGVRIVSFISGAEEYGRLCAEAVLR
jgi:hypothetical protein